MGRGLQIGSVGFSLPPLPYVSIGSRLGSKKAGSEESRLAEGPTGMRAVGDRFVAHETNKR
ncbi:MAG TPA: hypothetical protein VGF36_14950 [Rhodopila sp.]|jgi:hypothetical protein